MKKIYITPESQVELMEINTLCIGASDTTPADPSKPVLAPAFDDDLMDFDFNQE